MKKTYQRPIIELENMDLQEMIAISYTSREADNSTVLSRDSRFSTWEDDVEE